MLLGIKADTFSIQTESSQVEVPEVILGISPHNLTKNGAYSALIGIDILERSENKYESFEFAEK